MFCQKCGEEINDEAVVCTKCGCAVEKNQKPEPRPDEPKTVIGVVAGLFLGLIGLLIGICLYKEGTIARKTFIKAWAITFGVVFAICLIVVISTYINAFNTFKNFSNSLY